MTNCQYIHPPTHPPINPPTRLPANPSTKKGHPLRDAPYCSSYSTKRWLWPERWLLGRLMQLVLKLPQKLVIPLDPRHLDAMLNRSLNIDAMGFCGFPQQVPPGL